MENIEVLKNIFIFSGLDLGVLAMIQGLVVEEKYKKGQVIFWEGDHPQSLMILKKGKAKVFKQSKSGKETILRIVDAGDTFGELAIYDGGPHAASVKAMEPSSVMKIPRLEFLALLKKHPTVSYEIILDLTRRLREAHEVIQGLAVERVEKRIVALLLKLADRIGRQDGRSVHIPVTLTRQDIADMVGSTVETTIRIVSRMSKEGLIETKGKTIYILDIEKLKTVPEDLF